MLGKTLRPRKVRIRKRFLILGAIGFVRDAGEGGGRIFESQTTCFIVVTALRLVFIMSKRGFIS